MLSTPPAFILSQDQTLMLKFWFQSKFRLANFNRYYCCFGFVLNVLLNFKAYQKAFVLRIFRVLHTVQFSRFFVVVSATAHIFYHRHLCLSTTFLIYFLFSLFENAVSSTARLVYHENLSVSSTFLFLFFLVFFKKRNGERGIWTLAPVARPTPLAGAPLRPLEYFSAVIKTLFNC